MKLYGCRFQCTGEQSADVARCSVQLASSCKQLTAVGTEQNCVGRVAGWAVHFDRLLADSAGCATFAVSVDCRGNLVF